MSENQRIENNTPKGATDKLVYIPISELFSHPDNPRKGLGDLTELAESIKAKGIMQNLTVVRGHYITDEEYQELSAKYNAFPADDIRTLMNRAANHLPVDGGYTVIIGHRRMGAAKLAGLERVPCAIVEMEHREQVATMLLENIQRVDLTAFEQAQGFQMMMDLGDTVEGIAEKTGFSKKTVKHRLEMAKLNTKTLKEVSERQITMDDFDKLSKIKSIKKRNEVLASIGTYNFNNNVERAVKDELIAENMPGVVKAVKALGAKKMQAGDKYSGKYEYITAIKVTEKRDEDKPIIPKKYHKEELYYYEDTYCGDVDVYMKKKKAKAEKRPAAEIEREKAIDETKKQLKAMTETARVLRANFARKLVMHSKNRDRVLAGAIAALECNVVSYMYSVNAKQMLEFIGEKTSDDYTKNQEAFHTALRDMQGKAVPALIYLHFETDTNAKYYKENYNDFPTHNKNIWLDKLYDWLISLGYEMSDDERQLRDGTHPVFVNGKTDKAEK